MKTIVTNVEEDFHTRVKIYAFRHRQTISELIRLLLEKELETEKKEQTH